MPFFATEENHRWLRQPEPGDLRRQVGGWAATQRPWKAARPLIPIDAALDHNLPFSEQSPSVRPWNPAPLRETLPEAPEQRRSGWMRTNNS